jgi:hypothetical protein
MKEEKIDRLIRKTINEGYIQDPSPQFTENIMERLGVPGKDAKLKTKPIKSKWGLRSMIIIYLVLIAAILLIPGTMESTKFQLPTIELPSFGQYFKIGDSISKLLIMLILGGWFLIFVDNYVRRRFAR